VNVVLVYLRMYGDCALGALKAIVKNPWTLALPVGLSVAWTLAASLLGPLGIVGGFLMGLAQAAAFSAYLYFTGEVVSRSNTSLKELRKSFGVFFWSVIGLRFVLWIADLALDSVLTKNPQRGAILTAVALVELIALNAAPETIYIKGTRSGVDTIMASFQFLQEHWIEWFLPNGLLIAGAWLLVTRLTFVFPLVGALGLALAGGVLFHLVMVFRGQLYLALDGSTHRQRMYRYRTGA
jgi:hypothetical protein